MELQPDSVDFCAAVYKIFYEEEKAAGLLVSYILIPGGGCFVYQEFVVLGEAAFGFFKGLVNIVVV